MTGSNLSNYQMEDYDKNGDRHYQLSFARESSAFWRKSCGAYIVILHPELLLMV